jgi:hypothetical protein
MRKGYQRFWLCMFSYKSVANLVGMMTQNSSKRGTLWKCTNTVHKISSGSEDQSALYILLFSTLADNQAKK